ncbi:MAG: alkaline phosphatase family protein [Alphaproteobacteria bacterium]|nr:alkaline phosphatase family protein [Alphaproteobacteria bacterium]
MTSEAAVEGPPQGVGPILYFRDLEGERLRLAALIVRPKDAAPAAVATDLDGAVGPRALMDGTDRDGRAWRAWGYEMRLPARAGAVYRVDGETIPVDAGFAGDLRLAYVSCNGREDGDHLRDLDERDAMWRRLGAEHGRAPFHLLLHGGDQLYADEVLEAHPALSAWRKRSRPKEVAPEIAEEAAEAARQALFTRYLEVLGHPAFAWIAARVPSLAMWDDHDICDGWGSMPAVKLDTRIGEALFETARRHFLTFQMGADPDGPPPAPCLDETGRSLTWSARLPDLTLVAPDLRSERRPWRVMGKRGWAAFDRALQEAAPGRTLVLSSVPALGPRLSWIEAVMILTPSMQKYEDDLRDQWQSRAHRAEWTRFLARLIDRHEGAESPVTLLSGEIHLAGRATMASAAGPVHQLIASGIAHPPPPRGFARGLGLLAKLGEAPLPAHPIAFHPLPGRSAVYAAQRNYLVLERRNGAWRAEWELEESGRTPALAL